MELYPGDFLFYFRSRNDIVLSTFYKNALNNGKYATHNMSIIKRGVTILVIASTHNGADLLRLNFLPKLVCPGNASLV